MTEVLPFRVPERPAVPGPPAVVRINVYGALLADAGNPRTQRARIQDVADLARFLGLGEPGAAAELVVAGTVGQANALALGYGRHLIDRKLAAATINRRLSTVRRLVKLARRLGLIDWAVDVEGLRAEPYRDTAGPGADGWRRLLAAALAQGDGPKARRHWLRHQGITRALEVTGGNLRMVQRFSRHRDANTVQLYDDNREDLAGRVANLLGDDA